MDHPVILAAMRAVICETEPPSGEDFGAWLAARNVEGPDLEALVELGPQRFLVYRKLVHNRLLTTIREFVPRTVARLGRARLRADFERFMAERAPRSPYLRDIPSEFVAWAVPRWSADPTVPAYLGDLARHELLDFDVRNDPGGGEASTGEPLALDRPLRFDGSARLMGYGHAVHELPLDPDDRTEPVPRPVQLLVYRDAEHAVRYLELTPFAAAVLDNLLVTGDTVEQSLRGACTRLGYELDDDRLASAATLLADLAERGVMLGATTTIETTG